MLKKIYYHDTDCGGVVYYANYLKFFEEARSEFFAERGLSLKQLTEDGVLFVVARQEIDYKAPAVYGDILDIKAKITDISNVKMIFEQEVYNQEKRLLTVGKTVLVCVDRNLKPQALPDKIRDRLK